MQIPISEMQQLIAAAWRSQVDEKSAHYVADIVLATALGKDDRLDPIGGTLKDIEKFAAAKTKRMSVINKRSAMRLYDLNGCPGIAFLRQIHEESESLARENGIATIGLRNSAGIHELSAWVSSPPSRGFISIFAWNGGSYTTAPFGSREPFFGTNPIAYGIPTGQGPIVLDMSTSEIPFVSLNHAMKHGRPIPDRSGLDPEGRSTNDPNEVYKPSVNEQVRLLPLGGGYKGSAIMLLLEILTGALVGAKMSREATDDPWIPEEFGGLYICLDIGSFVPRDGFMASVANMAAGIRSSLPAVGVAAVELPGDRAEARARARRASGVVEVADATIAGLRTYGRKGGG